jgi:hypothetical protein
MDALAWYETIGIFGFFILVIVWDQKNWRTK